MDTTLTWQWILVIISSLALFIMAPYATTPDVFYKAAKKLKTPNTFVLTGSLVISWIFAKSITNAANLGLAFGLVGGLAYAAYYVSFIVAGIVIYKMRTLGGFTSIHQFVSTKFGNKAVLIFSVLLMIRLLNEVWSNTMVIGSYFGAANTMPYYTAIIVFTTLTLLYVLKGGLSSSIFTDVIQMGLFVILLAVILWFVFKDETFGTQEIVNSGVWDFDMGLNLFFAALLQSFSYPFHDPVLTDRGFISSPKTTLKSFILAGILGAICITLFSVVGIYAQHKGFAGQAAVQFGKSLGLVVLLIINFIMIVSASSTLDSTFSSFSKLMVVNLQKKKSIGYGRLWMVVLAVVGTIPVFLNAQILSATTISGTMIIGLTPIFIFWKTEVPKISFYLSVFAGLAFGLLLVFDIFPSSFIFTTGKYAELLWINFWGILCCITLYWLPKWIK